MDRMIIGDSIELGISEEVLSADPSCTGAAFWLGDGYSTGSPTPTSDFVASLIMDGERPTGRRASNRQISLPIAITVASTGNSASDRQTLAAARELILQAIDAKTWSLTWIRDGGLPMILDCFRAGPAVVSYSVTEEMQLVCELAISFPALPYGRSDVPAALAVASPLAGGSAPPASVVLDNYSSVSGAQWSQATASVVGPKSARWNPGSAPLSQPSGADDVSATYSARGLSANLTGLPNLSVWAGFGSAYFSTWHKGPVVFAFTLTDNTGNKLGFSVTRVCSASNNPGTPLFKLITAHIPQNSAIFNYANVASYSVRITNRAGKRPSLRYTQVYLDSLTANPPSLQSPASVRGFAYNLLGVQGTARTPLSVQFQQAGSGTLVTQILRTPGATQWVAPFGVSTISKVECIGAGGPGAAPGATGGGGGGAGEYAAEVNVAVTPLATYSPFIGERGLAGNPGQATTFPGDAVTVTAHGGQPAAGRIGGAGGTGSANTTHFNGGAGGNGFNSTGGGGGGGGGSGGSASAGNNGANSGGSTFGLGGAAVTGGGKGGNGATWAAGGSSAQPGGVPGSGGGGAAAAPSLLAVGIHGWIKLTYLVPPQFSTLIAHIPGPDAPDNLSPFVSFGLTDVPDGTTEYTVMSLEQGETADFGGTYSVVLVANAFNNPTAARNLTITVRQYEYQNGPSYSTSVTRNNVIPSNDVAGSPGFGVSGLNGIVVLGEITLPFKDVAPDNTDCYYTISPTSSNTNDLLFDCLLLDTMGQTTIVNVPVANAYSNMYIDEPEADRSIGRILGSIIDRPQAVSIMDVTPVISGGPLSAPAGDSIMFCYCIEGAPNLGVTYFPRWFIDRLY